MLRWAKIPVVLMAGLLAAGPLFGQAPVSLLYSLPADETWAEFEWKSIGKDGKERTGTLQISSVGTKQIQAVPYRWIEIAMGPAGESQDKRKIRKVLVAENAFGGGKDKLAAVAEGYELVDGTSVKKLTVEQVNHFLQMGIHSDKMTFTTVRDPEEIQTKLGKYAARHVLIGGESNKRAVEYHAWLSKDAPFGWAKIELHDQTDKMRSQLIFSAAATGTGHGAKRIVDETKAK